MFNYKKNVFVIGGIAVFLVAAGLIWNYTEMIKTKNAMEREKIGTNKFELDSNFEFQQKEKCLKLKHAYEKIVPEREGWTTTKSSVVYKYNSCFLFREELSAQNGKLEYAQSIYDLLKDTDLMWYPNAGQWSEEEFNAKKRELGF